jgi:predicted MFS family arabinose efflux permease
MPAASVAALAGLLVLAAAIGLGRFAYKPLLPPMQEALGWTVAQAGDVAAANFLGWMTLSFGLGRLTGPAVAGRLAHATHGFAMPSLVAAGLLAVGIALLWGLEKR